MPLVSRQRDTPYHTGLPHCQYPDMPQYPPDMPGNARSFAPGDHHATERSYMPSIALLTERPRFCPGCGKALALGTNPHSLQDWLAHCAHSCSGCGLHFQLVDEGHAIAAATASGGDLEQMLRYTQR